MAMQYAASGGRGVVFEIQQGMIDRGADIGWLSQYPHEEEILFAPLTGLEVQSTRCEETVLVVGVSLSVNLSSLTIEQVIGKFRKLVGDAAEGAAIDAGAEMMASTAPENADGVAELVRLACGERGLLRRDAEFFNDDKNLSWAMDAVVKVKKAALAAGRPRVFEYGVSESSRRARRAGCLRWMGASSMRCFASRTAQEGGGTARMAAGVAADVVAADAHAADISASTRSRHWRDSLAARRCRRSR